MRVILAGLVVLMAGCPVGQLPPDGDTACTLEFVYGLTVLVVDESGAPIEGATLVLTEGLYRETLEVTGDGAYSGAGERAGRYTLQVEADGFVTETIDSIVIGEDVCHVIPVSREIVLAAS